jgi:hypothetical protein
MLLPREAPALPSIVIPVSNGEQVPPLLRHPLTRRVVEDAWRGHRRRRAA